MNTWSTRLRRASRAERTGGSWHAGLKALLISAAVGVGHLGPTPPGALAQTRAPLDSGQFEIRAGTRVVGTETFAVREQGGGYTAVGRLTVERGTDALRSVELMLRTDRDYSPLRYELRTLEGAPRTLAVSRSGRRLRLTASTEEGERLREFLARPGLLLLERGVAHHYTFLARRLHDAGGRGGMRLSALVPAARRQLELVVHGAVADTIRLADAAVPAIRFDVRLGEEAGSLWIDPVDARVLRVEYPGLGWSATRTNAGEHDGR